MSFEGVAVGVESAINGEWILRSMLTHCSYVNSVPVFFPRKTRVVLASRFNSIFYL